MKFYLTLILLIILQSCSFDNKTGIWNHANEIAVKEDEVFKDFETLYSEKKSFNALVQPSNNLIIKLKKQKTNLIWNNKFYNNLNNFDNFTYKNLNQLIFKSKKLSRNKMNENILFDGKNVITTDNKGNIIVYSTEKQEIIYQYNFYKKKLKKIEKKLNFIIENGIIYIADNIGYLYAINYIDKKIIWAKNYKKPFRSNLKITEDDLLVADQDNLFYFINKYNGSKRKSIPTEEVILKNNFYNSLANDESNVFYLNTFGSLYSINVNDKNIQWFVNLNQSLDLNTSSLFYSNPIIINKNNVIVSSNPHLYILNKNSGLTKVKFLIDSIIKPISSGQKVFLITKDHLLVCIDENSGTVDFSIDINQKTSDFLGTKNKKTLKVKMISIVNDNLYLFLKNSYVIKISMGGKIQQIDKLPSKLGTFPIFINDSILYLNNKNRLIILD